jgi:two-component system response regulator
MTGMPIKILLVEDNPGDVRLTQEVLKDFKVGNTMHVAEGWHGSHGISAQKGEVC